MDAWAKAAAEWASRNGDGDHIPPPKTKGRGRGGHNANTVPLGQRGGRKRTHPTGDPMDPGSSRALVPASRALVPSSSSSDLHWFGPAKAAPKNALAIESRPAELLALPMPEGSYRLVPDTPAPKEQLALQGPGVSGIPDNVQHFLTLTPPPGLQ